MAFLDAALALAPPLLFTLAVFFFAVFFLAPFFFATATFDTVEGVGEAMRTIDGEVVGNTEAVGWILYMKYLVPFEVVSVVLLVAMIGAIVFGLRDAALAGAGEEVES